MTLTPIGNRVLLRAAKREEETLGGLLLPAGTQDSVNLYEIVAHAPNAKAEIGGHPIDLTPGTLVVVGKYVGTELMWEGLSFLLVQVSDLLGQVSE